jgi:hypothetical protein
VGRVDWPKTLKPILYFAAAISLLAVFWLQMVLALPKLSATTDEVAHLPAGYSYWATRDFRMNPEHPPLVKLIATLPLLAIKPNIDLTWPEWKDAQEYHFGYGFLYTNDADRLLFWSRLPMTLLATLGGLLVFFWAGEMFGRASGLFAVGLFAFCPNLLAHGMLVTTDVPVGVFMLLALYLSWKHARRRSILLTVGIGLATGAAMASKFSGAILPLIIMAFSVWRILSARDRREQALAEVRDMAVMGVSALLVIEASYFFLAPPWTYLENMRIVNANHNPNHQFYLFGNFSLTGWWYYFPVALAVKATVPLLITVALATVVYLTARQFIDSRGEMLILVTVVSYAMAIVLGADNLGVRYLLPLFPFLFIWGSRIAVELSKKPVGVALLVLLVGWQARAGLGAFPNYIPYFNELAGGATGGITLLDDSNLDWGQNMKQAAEYVRAHGLERVELLPFSPFDSPRYYGINRPMRHDLETYRMMLAGQHPPGIYIVSAHHLTRLMHIRPEWNPKNAIEMIGDSLWVFRF